MEAILLAGGKAERLGDAAAGRPKSLVSVGGKPLVAWQIGRLRAAGVTRVIVSCAAGQEADFERDLADSGVEIVCAGEPERLGRGGAIRFAASFRQEGGDVLALNGDELVAVDFGGLLARHRATGALATVTVAQPMSQFGQVELGVDDVVSGFNEVAAVPYWVNCGIYVLSAAGAGAVSGEGRPRDDDLPRARHGGLAPRISSRRSLADREHAQGAPSRRRARDRAPGVARVTSPYAYEPRRVDKPWGYELIWAHADEYVGKVLFVRAGQALSLQYHEQKDESWLVQSGRASLELGEVGGELTATEIGEGDAFRYRPGTVHRVTAIDDTTILEVSTPHLDDVVRLDDRYGRPERDR